MRLARSAQLDALCGEYLLGSLRGAARRRFERALREEPFIAQRLTYWQRLFALRYRPAMQVQPQAATWERLKRELNLARYATPWYRRIGLWQGWAIAATAALVLAISVPLLQPVIEGRSYQNVAQLSGKTEVPQVTAALSRDGRSLELRTARSISAGPQQSYELWLLPAEGGAPISLAVLGQLDGRFKLPQAQVGRITRGAKLAVSVEPAGGSPTGAPTGPVILVGAVES